MDEITKQTLRVQAFMASGKMKKKDLAESAGLGDTILIRARDKDWNPTKETLSRLVRAIDKCESEQAKKKARDEARAQRSAA